MPDPTQTTQAPPTPQGTVDITPQMQTQAPAPVDPALVDRVFDAILADPARVDRLLSHPTASARLNAVAASHVSRLKPAAPQPASSEPKPLDGRMADLERSLAEERQARTALEQQRAEESRDRALEEALRARGVRPELVPAAKAYLKSTALRSSEDGSTRLVVKRARSAGVQPTALEYDDLSAGVADWLQDPANGAFLPPPTPLSQQRRPLAINPHTGREVLTIQKTTGGNALQASNEALAALIAAKGGL